MQEKRGQEKGNRREGENTPKTDRESKKGDLDGAVGATVLAGIFFSLSNTGVQDFLIFSLLIRQRCQVEICVPADSAGYVKHTHTVLQWSACFFVFFI